MRTLLDRFLSVAELLPSKSKRYIHYNTLRNFIIHVDDIDEYFDKQKALVGINEYLSEIENCRGEIEKTQSYNYYVEYLKPLVGIYIKIGFKEIHRLRYQLIISTTIDIFCGFVFFKYPYPIMTTIVFFNHYIINRKIKNSTKVYSMFY